MHREGADHNPQLTVYISSMTMLRCLYIELKYGGNSCAANLHTAAHGKCSSSQPERQHNEMHVRTQTPTCENLCHLQIPSTAYLCL